MAQSETPETSHKQELATLSFTRGNPFATLEADQERSILEDLFVEIDHFERIRGARTVIVHAPRGCGKSAARVRLANGAAPWTDRPDIDTFVIEFLKFDGLAARLKAGQGITAADYVDAILRLGAEVVFRFLFAQANFRLERLSVADRVRLGRLVWRFAPDLLFPENAYERFAALLPGFTLPWGAFRQAVRDRRVSEALGPGVPEGSPAAALAFLLDMEPEDRAWDPPDPVERMSLLVGLVKAMGFQRLAILIDRVDEIQATTSDSEMQAALLEPLLSHLPLMEMPGVSFKLFIPTATREALLRRASVREDRLDIVETTVDWSESRLRELLSRRLKFFTGLPDFSQYASTRREDGPDGEESLSEAIEREMIALAAHSPRRLIRAGQLLLAAYLARPDADLLTWADWCAARDEMMSEDSAETAGEEISVPSRAGEVLSAQGKPSADAPTGADEEPQRLPAVSASGRPILYIYRRLPYMQMKNRRITLSETEVKIIRALIARDCIIDEEALADAVWQKAISTAGIDVALKRIRDAIDEITGEKKSGLRYYLTKKSGVIMLMNSQVCDDETQ